MTDMSTTTPSRPSSSPAEPEDGVILGSGTFQKGYVGAASNYIDERTSISAVVKEFGRKIFPDHWSFLLGEVALYSFVIILLSGTFLTFFFQASMVETHYEGSYLPLKGIEMSAAMSSSLDISFDIRGGLLMRQIHHWAALLFVASIGLHMLRIFFTGAFRKPRELNWVIGFVLFILAMAEGFTGYSLPDDLLSGNGLRIIDGMVKGIPIVGTWISFLLFGGEFPGTDIVGRLYTLHILLLPALVLAFIALHLVFVVVHKHTQFPGAGKTEQNVVGYPVLPVYAAKAGGFFFIVFGVVVLIASLFTINPIWNYGPYDPSPVSAGTQPTGTSASPTAHCVWSRRDWSGRSPASAPCRSTSSYRWSASDCSSPWSCCTRSSRRGSPATSVSTICSTARAMPRLAPLSVPLESASTPSSGPLRRLTSSRPTSTSRWRE